MISNTFPDPRFQAARSPFASQSPQPDQSRNFIACSVVGFRSKFKAAGGFSDRFRFRHADDAISRRPTRKRVRHVVDTVLKSASPIPAIASYFHLSLTLAEHTKGNSPVEFPIEPCQNPEVSNTKAN